jgi:DNA repair protein RAD5
MEPVFFINRIRAENFNKDLIIDYIINDPLIDNIYNNNNYYYSSNYTNTIEIENFTTNFINKCFNNDLYISWNNYFDSTNSSWLNVRTYSSLHYNVVNSDGEKVFNFKTEGKFPNPIKNVIDYINNNNDTCWSYKMCVNEHKSYGDEEVFHIQFLLLIDTKKFYKFLKKNKLSYIDINAIYFLFFYKNQKNKNNFNPSSDINPIWKNNTIKNIDNIISQPNNLKLKLYTYQLKALNWMISLENNFGFNFESNIPFNKIFKNKDLHKYSFNIIDKKIVKSKDDITHKIYSNGGILADEMGLGKTIISIALITTKPYNVIPNYSTDSSNIKIKKTIYKFRYKIYNNISHSYNKIDFNVPIIHTKANLIICPNHLTKQWDMEIKKTNPDLKIILLLTKTNHKKYSILDIINSDVVIVSFQFISNCNYYVNIFSRYERDHIKTTDDYERRLTKSMIINSFKERLFNIYKIHTKEFNDLDFDKFLKLNQVFLELFNWNRVFVDEGHEIFGEIEHYSGDKINNYIKKLILSIHSNYKWYISGTPFVNTNGLLSICKFINVKSSKNIFISNNKIQKININFNDIINEGFDFKSLYNTIIDNFYFRNTKESVKNEINIPPVIEQVLYINFTDVERSIYNSHTSYGNVYLRQFCCHPQISNIDRNTFGSSEISLEQVRQKIINDKKSNKEKLSENLTKLLSKPDSVNFEERKKKLETKITELTYIINFFNDINPLVPSLPEDNCIICLSEFVNPIVTGCGHYYCKECITNSVKYGSQNCPMCRKPLKNEEIYHVENPNKNSGNIDALTFKYGSKLGKLIPLCKQILQNPNNKIIIFSQWDRLLNMIASILKENNIPNLFCKGNVYQRSNAILSFRKNLEEKKKSRKSKKSKINNKARVIMLSTEHAASGTNLTEATHVIFMDPVDGTNEEIKSIEDQAVGRAVRIGQVNQVKSIRLITKNTLEEVIFKKTHDSSTIPNIDIVPTDYTNNSQETLNNITVI